MLRNDEIYENFELLLRGGSPPEVRSYFKYSHSPDELIDKVLVWGHYFMAKYLRDTSPEFHRRLIQSYFSNKDEYIAAPRGFSKTTVIQLCMSYSVANNIDKFIVLVEKTFMEAAEVIKVIHDEFTENERILGVYGPVVGKPVDKVPIEYYTREARRDMVKAIREREAMGDIFINGVRIRAKGFDTTLRGLKSKEWRPTRIILDDVEKDEHINNPDQRKKYRDNYDKGVLPAIDIGGSVKMYGTILHMDSLLKNKIDQHSGIIYSAHEGDNPATAPEKSFLWLERWSRERLIAKRNSMMSEGKSSNAYSQEFLNNPLSEEDRVFKWAWLYESVDHEGKIYTAPKSRMTVDEFKKRRKMVTLNGYAQIDAGDSTGLTADWTGSVVNLVDQNNYRYMVSVKRQRLNINGLIDLIFEIWKTWHQYGLLEIGVEKKAYEDQVKPLLDQEKQRRQEYPNVVELKPMGRSKENRISGALQGFIENDKYIFLGHNVNGVFVPVENTMDLLEELYNFPSSKNDDISDALAYGKDMIVVPFADQNAPTATHVPQDDPWEQDVNPMAGPSFHSDPGDPFA